VISTIPTSPSARSAADSPRREHARRAALRSLPGSACEDACRRSNGNSGKEPMPGSPHPYICTQGAEASRHCATASAGRGYKPIRGRVSTVNRQVGRPPVRRGGQSQDRPPRLGQHATPLGRARQSPPLPLGFAVRPVSPPPELPPPTLPPLEPLLPLEPLRPLLPLPAEPLPPNTLGIGEDEPPEFARV
jgi:hypothetical protein